MSEKRFVCIDIGYGDDWYITDNGKRLPEMEIVDLLNELNDENEQLKFENETLKSNYQGEIQSSIDFCNAYSKINGELLEEIEKLEKQNERLQWELDETRKDLNYFANLKIVMKGSDCGHDRCYVTSMQKKR